MKKIVLALVAAVAVLLLGFGLTILFLVPGEIVTGANDGTARPTVEGAEEPAAPAETAALEPPAEAAQPAPAPVPAPSQRSAAAAPSAAQLVGEWKSSERRVVRGTVAPVAGVPEDPTLRVFALSRELDPPLLYGTSGAMPRFARSRAGFDDAAEEALRRLVDGGRDDDDDDEEEDGDALAPEAAPPAAPGADPAASTGHDHSAERVPHDLASAGVVAVAPVALDGSFELPFPSDLKVGWIALDGRYLYSSAAQKVELGEAGPVLLQPEVGGWLTGTITLPPDVPAAEAYRGLAVSLSVDTSQINFFDMGGHSSFFGRTAVPDGDGRFEFRAVGANAAHQAFVRSEAFAHQVVKGLAVPDGQEKHVEIALVHGARVQGRVVDESGAPLPEANVRAATGSIFGFAVDRVGTAKSGADGTFELAHVAPGKVQFIVSKSTYLDSAPETLELKDRESREGLLIKLTRGASIGGRVAFADGRPAVGIEVDVSFDPAALGSMAALNAARGAEGEGKAEADGSFVVTGLGKGPFAVSATTKVGEEGYAARVSGVKPGSLELELVLKPDPTLRGLVVNTEGVPVTAFRVRAETEAEIFWMGSESEEQTFEDPGGAFELPGLKEGKWRVQASSKGWASSPWQSLILPLPEDAPPLTIVLEPEALAAGRVVDPDGRPVPGATVRPQLDMPQTIAAAAGRGETQEARTAEEGLFSLGGLATGTVTLAATHPEWVESEPVTFEVRSGETAEGIELKLRHGGTLTGLVYNQEGKPAANATIFVQNTSNFVPLLMNTDAAGTFRRENIKPGKWQVMAMLGESNLFGGGSAADNDNDNDNEPDIGSFLSGMRTDVATIEEGKETHLVLGAPPADPVKVTGIVQHAGEPVGGAMVTMYPENATGIGSMKFTTTEKDGTFAFELDHPGGYMMSVQIVGDSAMAQDTLEFPQVVPEAEEHHVKLELPTARISGTVYGVDGKPAAGTRITLTVDGGVGYGSFMGGRYTENRTGADGRFDIPYLKADTYSVAAGGTLGGGIFGGTADQGRVVKPGIEVKEGEWLEDLDFRLKAPGELTGRVVDLTGSPVRDAAVFVRDESGHLLERFSMITSNESGRFTYTGVAPGRYTLSARTTDLASAESEVVEVREGGSSEIVITVDAGTRLIVSVVDDLDGVVQATIKVVDDEGRQVNGLLSYQEILDASTRLYSTEETCVGPLSAGQYTITAVADDGRTVTKPVTLNGQAERKLKIRLK